MFHTDHSCVCVIAMPVKPVEMPELAAMNIKASSAISAAKMPPVMRHVTEWLCICDSRKLLIIGILKYIEASSITNERRLTAIKVGMDIMNTNTPNCLKSDSARNLLRSHDGLHTIHPKATIIGTDHGNMEKTVCPMKEWSLPYSSKGQVACLMPSTLSADCLSLVMNRTIR